MLELDLNFSGPEPTLLCVGAHCDDIEIGCGGTILTLIRRYPKAKVHWVILSSGQGRAVEANEAARLLFGENGSQDVLIKDFRISYFPADYVQIKDFFEEIKESVSPDVVFSHHREDLHQDHRVTAELTWNTFRDHLILEYEIPKFDGGLGCPTVFVPLTKVEVARKVDILMSSYATQRNKQWFSPETFQGLMRLRGIECNAPGGYAEAFYARKLRMHTSSGLPENSNEHE